MKPASLLLIPLLLSVSYQAEAETLLVVKPNKCVSMNKGQVCYQKLRFQFTAPTGDYCLFRVSQNTPLQCWQASGTGQYSHSFESDRDIEYTLVDGESKIVARTRVVVAWVYKRSRKRNRWRLF